MPINSEMTDSTPSHRGLCRLKMTDQNTLVGLERFFLYQADTLDANDKPLLKINSQIKMSRL